MSGNNQISQLFEQFQVNLDSIINPNERNLPGSGDQNVTTDSKTLLGFKKQIGSINVREYDKIRIQLRARGAAENVANAYALILASVAKKLGTSVSKIVNEISLDQFTLSPAALSVLNTIRKPETQFLFYTRRPILKKTSIYIPVLIDQPVSDFQVTVESANLSGSCCIDTDYLENTDGIPYEFVSEISGDFQEPLNLVWRVDNQVVAGTLVIQKNGFIVEFAIQQDTLVVTSWLDLACDCIRVTEDDLDRETEDDDELRLLESCSDEPYNSSETFSVTLSVMDSNNFTVVGNASLVIDNQILICEEEEPPMDF